MIRPTFTTSLLGAAVLLAAVLLTACGTEDGPGPLGDPTDASPEPTSPTPTETSPTETPSPLPEPVAKAVLGEHDADWYVWLERPDWRSQLAGLCTGSGADGGPDEDCAAALDRAVAGSYQVLGPTQEEEPSLELLVQGLTQQVAVFEDATAAEQFLTALREVVTSAGSEATDLDLGDASWTADYTDQQLQEDLGEGTVARLVAIQEGANVVVLNHFEDPDDPRLDTEPLAELVAERLAELG